MDESSLGITISYRGASGLIRAAAVPWDTRLSLEALIARTVGAEDYRFSPERHCSFDGGAAVFRIRGTDVRDTRRIPEGAIVYVGHLPEGRVPSPLPSPGPDPEPAWRKPATYFNESPGAVDGDRDPPGNRPRYGRAGLAQGFDRDRRDDAVGRYHDPYGLINWVPPARTASPPRTCADLQALDINPLARRDVVDEEMAIHWIWMGSVYDPGRGPDLIGSFLEAGGCRQPVLWTDLSAEAVREDRDREGPLRRLLEWCTERGVCLLSIDDVFCGEAPMRLQPLFNLARLQRQWGVASDLLRLEILHRFGGIYSDVDNECLGAIRPDLLARPFSPEAEPREDRRLAVGMLGEYPCNAFLIAHPCSPFVENYLGIIRSKYRLGRRQLCEQAVGGRCEEYERGFAASTEATVHEVVTRSGPIALAEALLDQLWAGTFAPGRALEGLALSPSEIARLLLIFHRDRVLDQSVAHEVLISIDPGLERRAAESLSGIMVPRELVRITTTSAWLARRVLPCSDADQTRVALTSILFHLVNNPPVLDLMNIDPGGGAILDLLEVIREHESGLLDGVREAWIPVSYPDEAVRSIGDRLGFRSRAAVREVLRGQEHDAAWVLRR
jgi:hypothetical protein